MAEHTQDSRETTTLDELAGKYLTFRLAKEEYGLEILRVREIIGLMDITEVPRTPDYVRGVINLRGKIIPVVELRVKFGMEAAEDTDLTCIIVVDVPRDGVMVQMGLLVDTVSEVLDIAAGEIEPPPSLGAGVDTSFILGIAKRKGEVRILLNVEQVLSTTELVEATQSADAAPLAA